MVPVGGGYPGPRHCDLHRALSNRLSLTILLWDAVHSGMALDPVTSYLDERDRTLMIMAWRTGRRLRVGIAGVIPAGSEQFRQNKFDNRCETLKELPP
jgi:hypothetical protein